MNSAILGLVNVLDRWVLLRTRVAAAEALSDERRQRAASLHAAGDARLDGALGESGVAALVLARAAVPCHLEAVLVARAAEPPPSDATLEELWAGYDATASAGVLPHVPPSLMEARRHASAVQRLDAELAEHGEARVDETLALAGFLSDVVEVRTARSVRRERLARIGGLVAALTLTAVVAKTAAPRPANKALHAALTVSSHRPMSGPPGDLTNGKIAPEAGIATIDEPDPWVTLDFGQPIPVSEVTLMGSDEHAEDMLPVRVETSLDGAGWAPAGLQKTRFTASEPAVLSFGKRNARFVRVHGRPGGALYLHEVEVR